MLGAAAASEQDATDRLASMTSILPLFTVEQVRNATRAKPHDFLGGCVQVAMATPPLGRPRAACVQRGGTSTVVLGVAPKVVLARRYRTPAPAPAASLAAAPHPKPAVAPRPKAVWARPPRGTAKKENVTLQNQTPTATGKVEKKKVEKKNRRGVDQTPGGMVDAGLRPTSPP